jgi:hypothetical protein
MKCFLDEVVEESTEADPDFDGKIAAALERREFDRAVEQWHQADTNLTVYEWLGLTEQEYLEFLECL